MIAIIDYGIGNLRSMEKALAAVGADVFRTDNPDDVRGASRIVLPGVGAFGACAAEIRRRDGLEEAIHDVIGAGKPFLGVCVGMQLLFDFGEEMGVHKGLGVIAGRVVRLDAAAVAAAQATAPASHLTAEADPSPADETLAPRANGWSGDLKIPHMGWNNIDQRRADMLLSGLGDGTYFYFVHSFVAVPENDQDVLASCHYGVDFPAVVQRNNVYGVQFHPEKSQQSGLQILRNFAELA